MTAPRVTEAYLAQLIKEGRGHGHGEQYKPFIQLARWNASPVSVQTVGHVPPFKRPMHFLSRSEWLIALLLAWVGCYVREQFPIWPWASPSPLYGISPELDARLKWCSGTLQLCKDAGINHGTFAGTSIPYIWTLDLFATFAWMPPSEHGAGVFSIKPLDDEEYTGDIDPLTRSLEKLEIERRCGLDLAIPYFVADRTLFPAPLLGQLDLFSASAYLPPDHRAKVAQGRLLEKYGAHLAKRPPLEWRDQMMVDYGLEQSAADQAVHNIFWNRLLDVDLTQEIQMEDVLRPGSHAFVSAFRSYLTGA